MCPKMNVFLCFFCGTCLLRPGTTSCRSDGSSETHHRQELTVHQRHLKSCKNKFICVSDDKDCEAQSSKYSPVSLNISCYLLTVLDSPLLSCSWHHEMNNCEDVNYSVILNHTKHVRCSAALNGFGCFNLTLRRRGSRQEDEGWFGPHLVDMLHAVKAPVPWLTSVKSSENSVSMAWTGAIGHDRCQVRYRISTDYSWTQVPEYVPVDYDKSVVYVIEGLQSYTNYSVSLACVGDTGYWSEWSDEVSIVTLESAPSKGLDVCYRLEKTSSSSGRHHLILMWKALNVHEAKGRILGYQVSYTWMTDSDGRSQKVTFNTTEQMTELYVWEQQGEVMVTACNSAGSSPTSAVSFQPVPPHAISTVRSLWARSGGDTLVIQWDVDDSTLPVSEFAIEWASHANPESKHWRWVDGRSRSANLTEHVHPTQTYTVSVYPIYHRLCGLPQSLPVSLEHGVLSKPVKVHVSMAGDAATVRWEWEMDTSHIRVDGYSLALRQGGQEQVFPVWPDVRQHIFSKLQRQTTYTVHLLADNHMREIIRFTVTAGNREAVAIATPLIFLSVVLGLLAILYKTLYKDYVLSQVTNPQASQIGQWLLKPPTEEVVKMNILNLEDFLVTGLQVESFTKPEPKSPSPSEEDDGNACFVLSVPCNQSAGSAMLLCYSGCEQNLQTELRVPSEDSQIERTLGGCSDCIQTWAPPKLAFTEGNTIECEGEYIVNTFSVQHSQLAGISNG